MCAHRAPPARLMTGVSRQLLELTVRPVILAGGMPTENVRRAILEVRPTGVDCHTGVEDSSGRKSREKVRKFPAKRMRLLKSLKQSSDHQQLSSKRVRRSRDGRSQNKSLVSTSLQSCPCPPGSGIARNAISHQTRLSTWALDLGNESSTSFRRLFSGDE
jgi:hypothetical protein